jgi:hypothetical protein
MERQAIERLAMDLALGELNEDAAALFDAYLVEHPQAQPWAQSMKTICLRTQETIHAQTCPMGMPARQTAAQVYRRPVSWGRVSRWAAVVAIALAIGIGAGRWLEPSQRASRPAVAVETTRRTLRNDWRQVLNESGGGFWESKAAAALQSPPRGPSDLQGSQPSLWEMLKQRQKEHRHV